MRYELDRRKCTFMKNTITNEPEGAFRTPKKDKSYSLHSPSVKPKVIVRKKDGTVIVPNIEEPVDNSSTRNDDLLPVSSEREREIRRAVRLSYSDLDIPSLAKALRVYRKEVLELDRSNAPDMSSVYVFEFPDKNTNMNGIPVKLAYSGMDIDGQKVLSYQVGRSQIKIYIKSTPDGTLLFSENKRTGRDAKYCFRPYGQAQNSKVEFGAYRAPLKYLKARGLADSKFYNLVQKLKFKYIKAIANYFVFLEQHGLSQRVDQMIEGCGIGDPQLHIPFSKSCDKQADENNDVDQPADIKDGDKICCKLSSVVTVMNTFQCLENQHHMVSIVLEILIKNAEEDMPFTKELQAYYCKECQRIFMYTSEYEKISGMVDNSHYCVFNRFNVDGVLLGKNSLIGTGWADESILKEAGYEVNQKSSLTQQERLSILLELNKRGLSYHAIVSYLNTFITVPGSTSSRDMRQAVSRWKSDLEEVRRKYMANEFC